jgi:hypothetical protein
MCGVRVRITPTEELVVTESVWMAPLRQEVVMLSDSWQSSFVPAIDDSEDIFDPCVGKFGHQPPVARRKHPVCHEHIDRS